MKKGSKHSKETIQKLHDASSGSNNYQFGKPLSKETREKLRIINLGENNPNFGKHPSEETRKKMSVASSGSKNPMFGKTGEKAPCFGRTGEKHPMFGITGEKHPMFGIKHTDETRKKISASRIGKYGGENSPMFGRTGENNPNFGKRHTQETKNKIRDSKLGKPRPEYVIQKMNDAKKGTIVSKETRKKMSIIHSNPSKETRVKLSIATSKERNPNWRGGTSFLPYCYKFDKKRKDAVRKFFNYLCICTGEPQYHRALSVHHVDHDKEQGCNGKPFNLVPMCDKHHSKEIYHHEEYKAYINKTLREGFKWGIWNEEEYMEKVMY